MPAIERLSIVRVRHLLGGAAIAALALSATPCLAQATAGSGKAAADNAQTVDEIVITGSSIRGVAPTGSTLISLTRDDIKTTSVATVTDLLRKIPQLSDFGGSHPVRADPMESINLPSIHGLPGAGLVLVLFDGYRSVGSGILATSPDPSSLPTSAIERVELVPDGASSVYGSDAVTGVINFVLRRNLNGVEADARYGAADHYHREDASITGGKTWSGGNVMASYQYAHNSILLGKDRSWYGLNQTSRHEDNGVQGKDYRETGCDPGTVTIGSVSYPIPLAGPGPANRCDYVGDNSLVPEETRQNVVLSARQNISDNVEIWGQVFGSDHKVRTSVVRDAYTNLTITSANPFFKAPPGVVATSEKLAYSPRNLVGRPLEDHIHYKTLEARAGLTWKITDNWQAKFVGSTGREEDLFQNGKSNVFALQAALAGTTPTTALNPFGATNQAVIDAIGNDERIDYGITQKMSEANAVVDGAIFQMPGGDVKLAFGASIRKEDFSGYQSSGTASLRNVDVRAKNDRTVTSEFAELFIPLVGAMNEMAGFHRLDVSASVRHDDYSDTGGTTNPKFGVNWAPIEGLTLRGSYSTAFHAPSIADNANSNINAHTQAFCCIGGPPSLGTPLLTSVLINGGNSNLKPETSKNYSFGFDAAPTTIPGLKFGASYFHVAFSNQIGFIPPNALYTPAGAKYYIANPTLAQVQAFIAPYPTTSVAQLVAQFGALPGLLLDLRSNNLGAVNFAGVDFNASYSMDVLGGKGTIGVAGTRLTLYETQSVAGQPFINQLGTGQGLSVHPIKWQARGNIGWSNDAFDVEAYLNYTHKYLYFSDNVFHAVRAYTPIDVHVGYKLPFEGMMSGSQVTLDVDNIFDQDPPYVNTGVAGRNAGNGFDVNSANPIGRVITVGVHKTF